MALYKSTTTTSQTSSLSPSTQPITHEEVIRYRSELSSYIAQFQQERQEVEALISEVKQLVEAFRGEVK